MKLQEYLALGGLLIVLLLASTVRGDLYEYDLQALLTESNPVTIDQETHYYDMFYIYSDGPAELTFDNYNANLISPYDNGEYSDPYLYLYNLEETSFPNINGFTTSYVLFAEDDDGNEDVAEGLFFYLDNIVMTNHMVAMVTSYDPNTTGTVDFTIISDSNLTIDTIPEPLTTSLIFTAGTLLIILRRTGFIK
tara:strand:+ start:1839 stop:2417 length:579 start_codon:yes stop_codon:yes gene_type:complete